MGFSGGGIARLKNGRMSRVTTEEGFYENANENGINQIVIGKQGLVWFGSDRGIFRARLEELNDVADGSAATLRSIHYGRSEGLPGVQARYGAWPGALETRDGLIW